jgi:hypothetical protein
MVKDPDPKSGRVAFDERGRSTWEWRVDTGTFSRDVDTQRLKQLQEEAGVTLKDEPVPTPGVDPYSVTTPVAPQKTPRRTLDDMRKLSEEIKRTGRANEFAIRYSFRGSRTLMRGLHRETHSR